MWTAVVLFAVFVALPGRIRSPFSGIPFSSQAHLMVVMIAVLVLAIALFPPARTVRRPWIIALVLLVLVKAALMSYILPEGWRGYYWKGVVLDNPVLHAGPLVPVAFFHRGVRNSRVDRSIQFDGANFALYYVNDWPPEHVAKIDASDIVRPLLVRWVGYIDAAEPTTLQTDITANGAISVVIDGLPVMAAVSSPNATALSHKVGAGIHQVTVTYEKPSDVKPAVSLSPFSMPVTPMPMSASAISFSRLAGYATDFLGLLALLTLAGAFVDAYKPIPRFVLEDIWAWPDRVMLMVVVVLFLLVGTRQSILTRGATMPLGVWDDPFAYEGGARLVLFHGPLMTTGDGRAFIFYPLYSYVLAGAHALLGEDYGTIRFLNWFCIAATAVLLWLFLRKWLTSGSLVAILGYFAFFVWAHVATFAHAPFSDNLFLPLAVATVLASAKAFENHSTGMLAIAGVLAALGAAARPSLLLFLPFFFFTILLFWSATVVRRAVAAGVFTLSSIAGLAPFTIRNWIVAHKFVLLVSSGNIMLPLFLYAPGVTAAEIEAKATGPLGAIQVFLQIFRDHPASSFAIEIRKVLFTLGFSSAANYPFGAPLLLFFIPLLYFVAVWLRRVPRPALIAINAFALSHMAAMVIATPWTYGYKTIVPFHLVLAAGAALLLPRRGEKIVSAASTPRLLPPDKKTVSVVLPTYNEKESIRQVILDFFATGIVDEVIVVNNNAAPGTSEEVAGTGAREIVETTQGYGRAIRRGLQEVKGDYVVICEPDGTFLARDTFKLLAYADDFDVVYGSRTSQQFVWRGANMGTFLRWGNWAVAKYMEFLFNATSLTDVGCTMRLVRREVAEALREEFEVDGSQFGPEMMVLTLRHGYRVVQVPVNYLPRVGESAVTGDPEKAFRLGLQMIWLITRHRVAEAMVVPPPVAETETA